MIKLMPCTSAKVLVLCVVLCVNGIMMAYAQKPTIMALPADRYLNEKGYVDHLSTTAEGETVVPDYRQALMEDPYLAIAIAAVNSAFQDANYPIQNFEDAIKRVDFRETEQIVSDRPIQQTMRDQLLSQARTDILLEIDFFEEKSMGSTTVSMTIEAVDSYSSQSIATVTQTGQAGAGTPFSVLVREAVIQNMPTFEQKLTNYFSSLAERGRVGVIEVTLGTEAPFDLEEWIELPDGTEEELGTIIKNLIREKAVNSGYHVSMQTRTQQLYDEVRVPLFDVDGIPIDVPSWANSVLVRHLRSKFGLDVRRETIGMGHARLVILGYR